jgi:hypothetical protein
MVSKTLGIASSKAARNVLRSSEYNLGTGLILLPVSALDEFSDGARHAIKIKKMSD